MPERTCVAATKVKATRTERAGKGSHPRISVVSPSSIRDVFDEGWSVVTL
ncbi:MAG: hypothetical protein M3203_11995 [Actinomycetota bacterium]|nr:hypothetical protein [Actinomycetota bacterium]